MKDADGFILCFSLVDKRSFTALDNQLKTLKDSCNMNYKTIVLVGCRADEKPHEVCMFGKIVHFWVVLSILYQSLSKRMCVYSLYFGS